jgi:hypothetical protein
MIVEKSSGEDTFRISEDGEVEVAKSIKIGFEDTDVTIEQYVSDAADTAKGYTDE